MKRRRTPPTWRLPCLLAGKLGGQFKTGHHLAYPDNTPMTNLQLIRFDGTRWVPFGELLRN